MNSIPYFKILMSTSAIVAISMGNAFAQDSSDPNQDNQTSASQSSEDEVVVTGSRIRRDTFSSPVSMDVLDADDAKIEGIADVGGLLRTASAASGSAQVSNVTTTAAANGGLTGYNTNGGLGAETIGLRGLGASRTLDLINGRRAGPSGTQGSIDAFDLGAIPLVGVERVDILKDGASAIYGSDAIAGVINYITDKSDRKEIEFFTSVPEEGGGEIFRGSATYGETFDRGRFRITADYYRQEELAREDRSYLDCETDYSFTDSSLTTRADVIDPRTGEPQCQGTIWGHVWVYDYGQFFADPGPANNVAPNARNRIFQFSYPGDNLGNFVPGIPTSVNPANGLIAPPGWFQVEYFQEDIDGLPAWAGIDVTDNGPNAVTNLYPDMQRRDSVIGEVERMTFMADGEFELTDDVTVYGEALFNRRQVYTNALTQYWTYQYGQSAAAPWFGGGDFSPLATPVYPEWGGAGLWFSPTPVVEHGDASTDIDYFRLVGGLTGDLGDGGPLPGWTWDVYAQYSDNAGEYTSQFVRNDSIQDFWFLTQSCVGSTSGGGSADTDGDGVDDVFVDGRPCTQDVRWFDPNFLAGDLNQAERDFLLDEDTGRTEFSQLTIEGYVTGDVIDLPAGKLKAALGYFFQQDEILDRPSDSVLVGNVFQGSQAGITQGKQKTSAIYGEASVPLVRDKAFFDNLEVILSGRYSEITSKAPDGRSASFDGFNYRATANWQISPMLRVRGTVGTSFRAPALYESFLANQSSSIRQSIDPCVDWQSEAAAGNITQTVANNCAAEGIPADYDDPPIAASVLLGGGFGVLESETSKNYTVGAVFTPNLGFGDLRLSVDYFEITVNNEIDTLTPAGILNGCYGSEAFATEPLCDLFVRGAETSPFIIDSITATFINVNEQVNQGIDVSLNYAQDTKWGQFDIDSQWSYQLKDDVRLLAESALQSNNGGLGDPKLTGQFNVGFAPMDNLRIQWGVDYIGEMNGLRTLFDQRDSADLPEGGGQYTVSQDGTTVHWKTETEDTFYHSLSAQYEMNGGWTFRAGVNNIFDEHPPALPAVDTARYAFYGNSPIVSQYDLLGRRAFFNISKKFN